MASTLVQTLLNISSLKIIDEQYGISVWSDLKVKRFAITSDAATANNPLSDIYLATSNQTQDALEADLMTTKVVQPVSASIDLFAESISTAMAIAVAFQVPTKTFRLVAKGVLAQGMAITKVDIDQDNEMLSAIKVTLNFEQAEIPSTDGFNPASDSNSDTYGMKVEPSNSLAATVQSVYNKVSTLWS